jgi:mRNA interferase RelE/StbE
MASYQLEWRRSATKDLRRIPPADLARILSVAEGLAEEQFPAGCLKLEGSANTYRVRVGNYRILYEIIGSRLVIEIVKVGHRRDIYRD